MKLSIPKLPKKITDKLPPAVVKAIDPTTPFTAVSKVAAPNPKASGGSPVNGLDIFSGAANVPSVGSTSSAATSNPLSMVTGGAGGAGGAGGNPLSMLAGLFGGGGGGAGGLAGILGGLGGLGLPGMGSIAGSGGILDNIPGWDSRLNPFGPQDGGIFGSFMGKKDDNTPLDAGLAPIADPTFTSPFNADGTLKAAGLVTAPAAVKAGTAGYTGFEGGDVYKNLAERATTVGPSAWLKLAEDRQKTDELQTASAAVGANAGAQAGARSNLSMFGGMTGGAAERLASSGARDLNSTRAKIAAGGASDRSNLGMQDETMKMDLLKTGAGLETQMGMGNAKSSWEALAADADRTLKADTTTSINDLETGKVNANNWIGGVKDTNDLGERVYGTKMGGRGGEITARAIERSGKK